MNFNGWIVFIDWLIDWLVQINDLVTDASSGDTGLVIAGYAAMIAFSSVPFLSIRRD